MGEHQPLKQSLGPRPEKQKIKDVRANAANMLLHLNNTRVDYPTQLRILRDAHNMIHWLETELQIDILFSR